MFLVVIAFPAFSSRNLLNFSASVEAIACRCFVIKNLQKVQLPYYVGRYNIFMMQLTSPFVHFDVDSVFSSWDLLFLLFQRVPLGSLAGIVRTSVVVWMKPLVITRLDAVHVIRVGKDFAVTKVPILLSESVFLKVRWLQIFKNVIYRLKNSSW